MTVPSVLSDIGAREDNLLVPGSQPVPDVLKDVVRGQTAFLASNVRNDAEGAELTASLLDLDHGTGASPPAVAVVRNVSVPGLSEALDYLQEVVFPVIAESQIGDPRLLKHRGMPLGIAADSHNQRLGILLAGSPQQLARLAVGDMGHSAGIENKYVGFIR